MKLLHGKYDQYAAPGAAAQITGTSLRHPKLMTNTPCVHGDLCAREQNVDRDHKSPSQATRRRNRSYSRLKSVASPLIVRTRYKSKHVRCHMTVTLVLFSDAFLIFFHSSLNYSATDWKSVTCYLDHVTCFSHFENRSMLLISSAF